MISINFNEQNKGFIIIWKLSSLFTCASLLDTYKVGCMLQSLENSLDIQNWCMLL